MKVMLDTNILVSSIFYPSKQTDELISTLLKNHSIVLCDYVLEELRLVVERKFYKKKAALEKFFSTFKFELLATSQDVNYCEIPSMRDHKDTPILATAIKNDVDIFITGDKDFHVLNIPTPKIMNMSDFLLKYK